MENSDNNHRSVYRNGSGSGYRDEGDRRNRNNRDFVQDPDPREIENPTYARPDDYDESRFFERRYRNRPYAEQPYRGIEYSDRGRRNSVYRNPDYGRREDFEHNRYRDYDQQRGYDLQEEYRRDRPMEPMEMTDSYQRGLRAGYMDALGHNTRGGYPDFSARPSHRGRGPKGYKRSDSRIYEDVCDALFESHDVDATDIDVAVNDGVVILSGTVDSRVARRDAETAVDYISGIRNIENRIHVHPEHEPHSPQNAKGAATGKKESNRKKDSKPHTGTLP